MELSPLESKVLAQLELGLPLVEQPYAQLASNLAASQQEVVAIIKKLREYEVVKRFGVIVRHRRLGFNANAMVVWNVPEPALETAATALCANPRVHLCYQRPRRPGWPYNLFCMIHGRRRDHVNAVIQDLASHTSLCGYSYDVLFSQRCFKQRGGRYAATA